MTGPVVHRAAPPQGLQQRCGNCGFVLADYENALGVGDWGPRWWVGFVEIEDNRMSAVDGPATCPGMN